MSNINNPVIAPNFLNTQTDATGSRAVNGTVYQNTTTKPIIVNISVYLIANSDITIYSDAQASPTLAVGEIGVTGAATITQAISFCVLPGNYYKAVGTNATLQYWIEYT
jgi:hypothetical protein